MRRATIRKRQAKALKLKGKIVPRPVGGVRRRLRRAPAGDAWKGTAKAHSRHKAIILKERGIVERRCERARQSSLRLGAITGTYKTLRVPMVPKGHPWFNNQMRSHIEPESSVYREKNWPDVGTFFVASLDPEKETYWPYYAENGIAPVVDGHHCVWVGHSKQEARRVSYEWNDKTTQTRTPLWKKFIPIDRLKSIVAETPTEESLLPLLLFGGPGRSKIGRYQGLWNLTRAAHEIEAASLVDVSRFARLSTDTVHLCGVHGTVDYAVLHSFLSRVWYSPTVLGLAVHLREWLAELNGFWPLELARISPRSHWTTQAWRKFPRKEREPRTPPLILRQFPIVSFYPFISGDPTKDHDLILAIHNVVPRGLPEELRRDVCQDLAVAILSGEVEMSSLVGAAQSYIGKVFKEHPIKYGPLSLDAPPPWDKYGRPLLETLTKDSIAR